MARYNLTTIRPTGFLHSSAFAEVKDSLAWALTALGHEVLLTENTFSASSTNVLYGTELLDPKKELPRGSILFNYEQPSHPNVGNVGLFARKFDCPIWDFSARNVERWRKDYSVHARHVPVGYTPNLTRIPRAAIQDIDVAFLGWLTPRRQKIIDGLRVAGLNVYSSQSCYGGARDQILSRSKVVLNVHHDGRDMFEIVRVSYLLANRICVVSEISSDDNDYSLPHVSVEYERLVDVCKSHCADSAKSHRLQVGDTGFEFIVRQDYVRTVATAIGGGDAIAGSEQPVQTEPKLAPTGGHRAVTSAIKARYVRGCLEGDMRPYLPWLRAHAEGNVLEIGVRDGASTSALLLGVEAAGGRVYSIDIEDCSHLWTHPQWTFTKGDSKTLLHCHAADTIDLAFIDGDHSRVGFHNDLLGCYRVVRPGGIICCHDIAPPRTSEEFGGDWPSRAIREEYFHFVESRGLRHEELPGYAGLGVIYKP